MPAACRWSSGPIASSPWPASRCWESSSTGSEARTRATVTTLTATITIPGGAIGPPGTRRADRVGVPPDFTAEGGLKWGRIGTKRERIDTIPTAGEVRRPGATHGDGVRAMEVPIASIGALDLIPLRRERRQEL